MVAQVGHVPHNCGYESTHADNTCAGLALAVPSSNCIVAHPHLILDCGTVPTLNFSAKLAWPLLQNKYLQMAVVQMFLDVRWGQLQLVDAKCQRMQLCVVQLWQVW